MLDINKISHTTVFKPEWYSAKLGCISASLFGNLIGENSEKGKFSKGAITLLEGLAGERITGLPARQEFFTDATNHGNATEPESIDDFCGVTGMSVLRNEETGTTARLIKYDEYRGCTPDGLVCENPDRVFNEAGTHLNVSTLEVKNPLVHSQFIKLYKCTTPAELKAAMPLYYWQVIFQMFCTDVMRSYFAAYSPIFKRIRIIEFKKTDEAIRADLKKAKLTSEFAVKEIENIVGLLK